MSWILCTGGMRAYASKAPVLAFAKCFTWEVYLTPFLLSGNTHWATTVL